jgi:hypothetical protein
MEMLNSFFAIRIRGWILVKSPADQLLDRLRGERSEESCRLVELKSVWTVVRPVSPMTPIGEIGTFLVVTSARKTMVELAPGSQGCERPPEGSPAIISTDIQRGITLVMDARCWLFPREPHQLTAILRIWN